MSASRAYALAYARERSPATRASAARLLTNANIQSRINDLRREGASAAGVALETLVPKLHEAARAAISAGHLREASRVLERLQAIAAVRPAQER
jgi:hypothetical protein